MRRLLGKGLADAEQAQQVVNVLCAYLRTPPSIAPGGSATIVRQSVTTRLGRVSSKAQGREVETEHHFAPNDAAVRAAIIGTIASHVNWDQRWAKSSWCDLSFDFSGAEFLTLVNFQQSTFRKDALFIAARFYSTAVFRGARFHQHTGFTEAKFYKHAVFTGAHFYQYARFAKSDFQQRVTFDRVHFLNNAGFSQVQFRKVADFQNATFHKIGRFFEATFQDEAVFTGTKFLSHSQFDRAIFRGDAWFADACFHGATEFVETDFGRHAKFDTSVGEGIDFSRSMFRMLGPAQSDS